MTPTPPQVNDKTDKPDTPVNLDWWKIQQLERQGCTAENWDTVFISPLCDLPSFRNIHFGGRVVIEAGAKVRNVPGGIINCTVGRDAMIENVGRIEFEPEAPCGVGIHVSVLDETGSRPVTLYPGLSAQVATLMARVPSWPEHTLSVGMQEFLDSKAVPHAIGEGAKVIDCGRLLNVSVAPGAVIEGASSLVNGTVINNAPSSYSLAYVGSGVDAENFIIEDGKVGNGSILRNCYVGQGAEIEKGFTAHDSLFFANCSFENGEACALLAGPYSVSMHKGTLMIGCQTSFMNAGSATNQSNHMYKLGPVHWGVLERGVKTASGAYIMLGAKIGAFSMVMGQHKTHPDSSSFPFSYLFGDERGATVVVPAAMLRSCGLLRDEKKWPTRDRRAKVRLPLHDRITFNVLNPYTVEHTLNAIETIAELLSGTPYDDLYFRHKNMKFTRAALERAKVLYTLAIYKYLSTVLPEGKIPVSDGEDPEDWVDVGGQVITRSALQRILATETVEEAEKIFDEEYANYEANQILWISRRFGQWWREHEDMIAPGARQFDELVEEDRQEYLDALSRETKMLSL